MDSGEFTRILTRFNELKTEADTRRKEPNHVVTVTTTIEHVVGTAGVSMDVR